MAAALALAFAPVIPGAYSGLLATSDAKSVYFTIPTSYTGHTSFVARLTDAGVVVETVDDFGVVQDVSADGAVQAYYALNTCFGNFYMCAFSECLSPFHITGPGMSVDGIGAQNYGDGIRLDRQGKMAWINSRSCSGTTPSYSGLFAVGPSSLTQVAAAGNAFATGGRMITDDGRALTVSGWQLQWLDAAGSHPIVTVAHPNGSIAYSSGSVADASGANVVYGVYTENPVPPGNLHWIDTKDEDLGFAGFEPALSDDGSVLAFLAPEDQSLQLYDRATRGVRRLGTDTFSEFVLSRDFAFGRTTDGRLVRVELKTGTSEDWLQPFPAPSMRAPTGIPPCSGGMYCFGDSGLVLGRGMILQLQGQGLNYPGLRARLDTTEVPLHPVSESRAWLQVPSDLTKASSLVIYSPDVPMSFSRKVWGVGDRVVVCLDTLHEDASRSVTADSPAVPGEMVHVLLTGLHGVEPVPDGVPNPSDHLIPVADLLPLTDPGFADVVNFALAWGLVGIEQLDLRVLRQPSSPQLFAQVDAFICTAPAVSPAP